MIEFYLLGTCSYVKLHCCCFSSFFMSDRMYKGYKWVIKLITFYICFLVILLY